jgi:hypothetical protein
MDVPAHHGSQLYTCGSLRKMFAVTSTQTVLCCKSDIYPYQVLASPLQGIARASIQFARFQGICPRLDPTLRANSANRYSTMYTGRGTPINISELELADLLAYLGFLKSCGSPSCTKPSLIGCRPLLVQGSAVRNSRNGTIVL